MTLDETHFDRLVTPPERSGGLRFLGGAIAISCLLHAVVAIALIDRVKKQLAETEETPILVQLVPPPEPEEPRSIEPEEPEPEPAEPETTETEEPEPDDPSQAEEQLAGLPSPLRVMRPVVEFGETDSGPRINPDGDTAQDPDEAEPEEPAPPEPDTAEAEEQQSADSEALAVLVDDADEASTDQEPGEAPLTPAEQLYSATILGGERARTAINGMPRSERAGELCMTEMRAQLLAADRPADRLPRYVLPTGTVLETRHAAFRSAGQWFNLAFRCEVDNGVTRVLNFSYRIGDAVPRAQWSQRGFPEF